MPRTVVREVRIDGLRDESFEGKVVPETAQGTRAVRARPSEGIALGLNASAPIKVATTAWRVPVRSAWVSASPGT